MQNSNNMKKKNDINKSYRYTFYLSFAVTLIYVTVNCITESFLWYDESGQFYIAKGLCHYSPPYSEYSGISDVLYYNKNFNMDPGGYSVLLHFWTMVSNNYIWLRLFSAILFASALLFIYRYSYEALSQNKIHALLLVSSFALCTPFTHIIGEVRAYTMEMLGVAVSVYLLNRFRSTMSFKQLLSLATILFFFQTSRYSFIIYCFIFSLCVLYQFIKIHGINRNIYKICIYGLILFIGVVIIYFTSMKYQNARASKLWYLDYLGSNLKLLYSGLSIRMYILVLLAAWDTYKRRCIDITIVLSVCVNLCFFILSLLDMFPWNEQRALPMTIMQYLIIGIILLKYINKKYFRVLPHIAFYLLLCNAFANKKNVFFYTPEADMFNEMIELMPKIREGEKIYTHECMVPNIRYQFEEGVYKNMKKLGYTEKFILSGGCSHGLIGNIITIGDVRPPEQIDCTYYLLPTYNGKIFEKLSDKSCIYVKK